MSVLFQTTITFIFLIDIGNTTVRLGHQQYAAKGTLLCGSTPAHDVQVVLVDIDRAGRDDIMGQTFTDENGRFFVTGRTYELTTIEPVLKFYHKCSDGFPCNRRWKLALPRNKITRPTKSLAIDDPSIRVEELSDNLPTNSMATWNTTLDVGTMNLQMRWQQEKRKCIH